MGYSVYGTGKKTINRVEPVPVFVDVKVLEYVSVLPYYVHANEIVAQLDRASDCGSDDIQSRPHQY